MWWSALQPSPVAQPRAMCLAKCQQSNRCVLVLWGSNWIRDLPGVLRRPHSFSAGFHGTAEGVARNGSGAPWQQKAQCAAQKSTEYGQRFSPVASVPRTTPRRATSVLPGPILLRWGSTSSCRGRIVAAYRSLISEQCRDLGVELQFQDPFCKRGGISPLAWQRLLPVRRPVGLARRGTSGVERHSDCALLHLPWHSYGQSPRIVRRSRLARKERCEAGSGLPCTAHQRRPAQAAPPRACYVCIPA